MTKKKLPLFFLVIITGMNSCISHEKPFMILPMNRDLLSKSELDQTSIFDTNNDKIPDIERYYVGSGIAFEKTDLDFDGFWDYQGQTSNTGEFTPLIRFPEKKYSVIRHHIFVAQTLIPQNFEISAAKNDRCGKLFRK